MNKQDKELIIEILELQLKQIKALNGKINATDRFVDKLFDFVIRER